MEKNTAPGIVTWERDGLATLEVWSSDKGWPDPKSG